MFKPKIQGLHFIGGEKMPEPRGKKSFRMWLLPSTLQLIENNYKRDQCRSRSQYIERAVEYYTGHINAQSDTSYLPNAILSNLKAIVDQSTFQQNRLMFKLCVELAMIENVLVALNDIESEDIEKLRGDCIDIIKRTNGSFKFEDAAKWQNK